MAAAILRKTMSSPFPRGFIISNSMKGGMAKSSLLNTHQVCYSNLIRRIQTSSINFCCVKIKVVKPKTKDVTLDYISRNKILNRPMAPSFFIYRFHFLIYMSGFHRATGVILSVYSFAFGVGHMFLPQPFTCYVDMIRDMELNWYLLAALKTGFVVPFCYHWFNGIRHLIWDMGIFVDKSGMKITGYTVALLSTLATAYVGVFL